MNAKKAKALRHAVRAAFHKDPTEVETDKRRHHTMRDSYGKAIGLFEQRVLHKHCGRAVYQRLKKAIRTGVLVRDELSVPRYVRRAEAEMEHAGA